MGTKKRTQKELDGLRDWAETLITVNGLSQKEAAERVDVTAATMNKWYHEGKWGKLKTNLELTKKEQLINLYDELEAINGAIRLKPEGERFADSKEADARRKLLKDIESLEKNASLPEVIQTCHDLLEFVRKVDLKIAQDLRVYVDGYVKSLL